MSVPFTPLVSVSIDTGALRHNLEVVRARAPRSRIMAVIKANAYGHGMVAVAKALDSAEAFAVARVDEGLTLRAAGVKRPIVLLEGVLDRAQLDAAAAAAFELVVHTAEQIELLRGALPTQRFRVWLKLDSGMNRLGFKLPAFAAAHAAVNALPAVQGPANLFTHLASADVPGKATTDDQLNVFESATRGLRGERCIDNSAAIFAFPNSQADWVRPGLVLYGASPFAGSIGADYGLRPVMTLQSHIIATKPLSVGEHVGYGGDWTAARPSRLAIAAVGYGDGYPRSLPSGTPVLVNGERAVLAGRVSMDMIGIDITDLRAPVRVGDPVVLWGTGLPVEEVAVWAQTIPYELFCGISQRVAVRLL